MTKGDKGPLTQRSLHKVCFLVMRVRWEDQVSALFVFVCVCDTGDHVGFSCMGISWFQHWSLFRHMPVLKTLQILNLSTVGQSCPKSTHPLPPKIWFYGMHICSKPPVSAHTGACCEISGQHCGQGTVNSSAVTEHPRNTDGTGSTTLTTDERGNETCPFCHRPLQTIMYVVRGQMNFPQLSLGKKLCPTKAWSKVAPPSPNEKKK